MQVMRDEKKIKRHARIGTYTTLAGLAVLVLGMIVSFKLQYLYVSMGALILGFALSQIGNYYLRRWGRSPRPDELVESALKGFDDRYKLYAWTLPTPYVLLSPQGVYTITTRDQTGDVSVNGARWHHKLTAGRVLMLFGQEGLGNPTMDALDSAKRIEEWIKSSLPDFDAKVQPVILFLSDRIKLQIVDPTVPVLLGGAIKKWLRGSGKGNNLKTADYKAVEALFDARVPALPVEAPKAKNGA